MPPRSTATVATGEGGERVVVVEKKGITCKQAFIYFLRFIKVLACLALLTAVAAHALVMKGAIESKSFSNYDKAFIVLGSSGFSIICLIQVVLEFEIDFIMARIKIMKLWVPRGLVLIWQGVETIYCAEQLHSAVGDVDSYTFVMLGRVVGWFLIGIGFLYFLFGVLCLRQLCGASADELDTKLISDDQLGKMGVRAGPDDEARIVISNMAIALNITTTQAYDMFSGSGGAEEARRMRAERAEASSGARDAAAEREYAAYRAPEQPYTPTEKAGADSRPSGFDDNDPHGGAVGASDARQKRLLQTDADLEAQYYASRHE